MDKQGAEDIEPEIRQSKGLRVSRAKIELQEDVRRSLIRDHSEILQIKKRGSEDLISPEKAEGQPDQISGIAETSDGQILQPKILIQSNSANEIGALEANDRLGNQPFNFLS